MHFDESFIRRINDEEYQVALSQYLEELCEQENKAINEECKKNPFLKKRIEKAKAKINNLTSEDFAKFMSYAIQKNAQRMADKVTEFNKKWDKEHYKVIYANFENSTPPK